MSPPASSSSVRRPRHLAAATVAVALGAGVLVSAVGSDPSVRGASVASAALRPFDGCADLEAFAREQLAEQVSAYGLRGRAGGPVPEEAWSLEDGGDATAGGPVGSAFAAGGSSADEQAPTGTNLQERGVDEPDVAKLDGDRLVVLQDGDLVVVDVSGDEPVETSRLSVVDRSSTADADELSSWPAQPWDPSSATLLLHDDRVLVLRSTPALAPTPAPVPRPAADGQGSEPVPAPLAAPRTSLTAVDLSGPSPRVLARADVDGELLDARLTDGVVRVATSAPPVGLPLVRPGAGGVLAEQEALEANRAVVGRATPAQLLPGLVVTDADGDVVRQGLLLDCEDVARPAQAAGAATLSLLALDLGGDDPLTPRDVQGLLADGGELYATATRTVVTTSPSAAGWGWPGAPALPTPEDTTAVHLFDTSDALAATYVASGEVDGVVQDRWGLSWRDGRLRVVSTTVRAADDSGEQEVRSRPAPAPGPATTSSLLVLRVDGGEVVEVGRADGIGRDQDVWATRFVGDAAYVVTFRQVDPLHVVDLSDPDDPVLRGELEVPGYSAYLHPVDDGTLLGVGAAGDGRPNASVFDVSDPQAPRRTGDVLLLEPDAHGEAVTTTTSRAFAWDPGRRVAVLPVSSWSSSGGRVVAVEVRDDGSVQLLGRAAVGQDVVRRAFLPGDGRVVAVGADEVVVLTLVDGLPESGRLRL